MKRRDFLKRLCMTGIGLGLAKGAEDLVKVTDIFADKTEGPARKEALYYKKIDETTVQCQLCPRGCTLSEGQRSFCRVREPHGGKLYTLAYGAVCAAHVDPIEKKPLFHFLPGTPVFSIATAGCNYRCKYCQNWEISQTAPDKVYNEALTPEDIISRTKTYNCPTIAYTYTEPSIFYEYMLDTAKLAKSYGIRNMYHSNGSLNPAPAEEISLYLDAADIDLKGFTQDFYSEVSAGDLNSVLATLRILKKNKVWIEITNLVVPTLNDDMKKIGEMCAWIRDNLGPETPVHFARFLPQYKLATLYPTPIETLEKARETALASGLQYIYLGNVAGHPSENTTCHSCKKPVILRSGYTILENHIKDGTCAWCGADIPGVWS